MRTSRTTRRLGGAVLAVVASALPLVAQEAPPGRTTTLAFTHATIIDVESGRRLANMTVVADGDRIRTIGPSSSVSVPSDARVIDAAGKYLLPGLWDMHVHAAVPWLGDLFLPLLVANGVTGVREMFSQSQWVDSSRARIRSGRLVGPRIVASGHILDGSPPVWPGSVSVRNADEARHAVDSLKAAGADFIKVYSRLTPEEYRAVADESKRVGLSFAGHVPTLMTVTEASDAGQRSIEHLTGVLTGCSTREQEVLAEIAAAAASTKGWDSVGALSRAQAPGILATFDVARCTTLARNLAKNGTWMVPTIAVLHSISFLDDTTLAGDPRMRYIPPMMASGWNPRSDFRFRSMTAQNWATRRAVFTKQLEIVTLLHREGVRFLAGTDLSNPYIYPGFSLHDELASLVAAGFSPLEALRSATIDAARFLGAADSLGSVAMGKRADLLLLDADPLADIRNTTRIAVVVAAGRVYDSAARERMLADEQKAARSRPGSK